MDSIQYQRLRTLKNSLCASVSSNEKLVYLNQDPSVQKTHIPWPNLSLSEEILIKLVIALGESKVLFSTTDRSKIQTLLASLEEVDYFYREIGGLVGYQLEILRRIYPELANEESSTATAVEYRSPSFIDISEENATVHELVRLGIQSHPLLAEFYPLGGAADRLHLVDATTSAELPAAKLPFAGKTLFEGLIRDLQAREFLYFQLTGQEHLTPLAIMTSHEKENHRHILSICEEAHWFGRPKELFRLFPQPLVPAVDAHGHWIVTGPAKLLLKPGGHGALWKLAKDQAIFTWLASLGRTKALIRQINNPLAGIDSGLLSFLGYGVSQQMHFGFASCPRLLQAAEGVNVLIERKYASHKEVLLTNIEYCDFQKFGITEAPLKDNSPYSRYSSNTNILFTDLATIEKAIDLTPFPGLLINLKKSSYTTESGGKQEEPLARLESTMQNIADVLVEERALSEGSQPEKTFVTYNSRHKTISTAKRAYLPGGPLAETPEGCFYDLLQTHRELLERECQMQLPPQRTLAEYLQQGPEYLFLYHPALGPLYSMIRQKIQKGSISTGSLLQLEIGELSLTEISLAGSLEIHADHLMGNKDPSGILHYSRNVGRCILHHVKICNRGVDWTQSLPVWKGSWHQQESLSIHLKGHSEFRAEQVSFSGNHYFEVEDGMRMEVHQEKGRLVIRKEPISLDSLWHYKWGEKEAVDTASSTTKKVSVART